MEIIEIARNDLFNSIFEVDETLNPEGYANLKTRTVPLEWKRN